MVAGNARQEAIRRFKEGSSDVSKNWRDTFAIRSAKAQTGNAGNLSRDQQNALRDVINFQKLGSN